MNRSWKRLQTFFFPGYLTPRVAAAHLSLPPPARASLELPRVLKAVSRNWAMLWQTAMLVVIVLFIFAAVGTAGFEEDFALGAAVEAVKPEGEDFAGCDTLGQV